MKTLGVLCLYFTIVLVAMAEAYRELGGGRRGTVRGDPRLPVVLRAAVVVGVGASVALTVLRILTVAG
jgi:hypothetical protein